MSVFILGAGPTGLAAADGLVDGSDLAFTVIERERQPGGMAKTVGWGDRSRHDLGPHKIFSPDLAIVQRVLALLPDDAWLTRSKESTIYMDGHFLPYPPSLFSLVGAWGLGTTMKIMLNFAATRFKALGRSASAETFEEDLQRRVGTMLYERLFKPITMKLWGDPAGLDVKLSAGRVQTPSVLEFLRRLLKLRKKSGFEAMAFHYPCGGLGKLWDRIHDKSGDQGAFLLDSEVTGLTVEDGRVRQILVRRSDASRVQRLDVAEPDVVLSTLPLPLLPGLFGDALPEAVVQDIGRAIRLNDLMLVFFKIDADQLMDESWVFVPDPAIVFHRLSEQGSFDPGMTPGGSIVCCEIMDNDTRAMSDLSDEQLCQQSLHGLRAMGYDVNVRDKRVIRLPASYPVFGRGYEPALHRILAHFDCLGNFRTIGRQGAFNYVGTLDSMDIGYGAAEWILRRDPETAQILWQQERQRTSYYPVLD